MTTLKWLDGSASNVITTGANTLANNGLVSSGAIDNDADQALFVDIDVLINGFGASVAQGVKVAEVYLCPTVDGTNYPDGHDAAITPAGSLLVGVIEKVTSAGTGAVRGVVAGVPLPPRDFKVVVKNTSGQAWAASGNVVAVRPYRLQSV
jgi:hypothetical protein